MGHKVTANRSNMEPHQVMVVLSRPDVALIDGLRSVGLAPIAEDGEVVICGRRLQPLPTPSPTPTQSLWGPNRPASS
jgi:hypothetical protein